MRPDTETLNLNRNIFCIPWFWEKSGKKIKKIEDIGDIAATILSDTEQLRKLMTVHQNVFFFFFLGALNQMENQADSRQSMSKWLIIKRYNVL